jgi:hypothetical protein
MKLARAEEHLAALNTEAATFLNSGPYDLVTARDAGIWSSRVVYHKPAPNQLIMLIGDVLSNLRAALDHLAWGLAGRHADKRTEFPIFIDHARFHGSGRASGISKMHDMPVPAQDIIESMQPYHGSLPEMESLWLLQQLNNEDKHHALNLVAAGIDVHLDVRTGGTTGITGRTGYVPLEDGSAIWTMPLAQSIPIQDFSRIASFDLALDPTGPGKGMPLRDGLRTMRDVVSNAILSLETHIP